MKNRDIVDIHDAPEEVVEIACVMCSDCHEGSPYYEWEVVENPTGEEEGLGYLTDWEAILLTDYCKAQGAEVGQTVLIHTNW